MRDIPDFAWCPLEGCTSGQVNVSIEGCPDEPTLVVCHGCNKPYCLQHNTAWHKDLTCDEFEIILQGPSKVQDPLEYERLRAKMDQADRAKLEDKQRRAEEDKRQMELSEKKIRSDTIQCPQADCGWQIEREGGCHQMFCESPEGLRSWCRHLTHTDRSELRELILLGLQRHST